MEAAAIDFGRSDSGTLVIGLSGDWRRAHRAPAAGEVEKRLDQLPPVRRIAFRTEGLHWDSLLLTFLIRVGALAAARGIPVEEPGLPKGIQRLLALASAVPERTPERKTRPRPPVLDRLGSMAVAGGRSFLEATGFLGEAVVGLGRLLTGRAAFRLSDLLREMQQCGAEALPIVSLISFLIGLILAFVGALQLKLFGAQIYVASIVGIGMVRALSPIMTAILMAGRTGASFAAELGTMQVNEEVDALRTLGISPMEILVLPRMLAISLMMPLLCLYADLMGILGGVVIGVAMLDLNALEYYAKTCEAVRLTDVWVGLFSAAVFGVLIALFGCLRGMQCRGSAAAVGRAATSAVVTSIVGIVAAMAVITVLCDVLKV